MRLCLEFRRVLLDRKSTRLNSSHGSMYAVFCLDRKSTRLNSSHGSISYAVFCLKKKKMTNELPESLNEHSNTATRDVTVRCPPLGQPDVGTISRKPKWQSGWMYLFFFLSNALPPGIYPFPLPAALPI